MDVKNKKGFRKTKIAIISLVSILLISVVGFFIYASDYYRAEDIAIEVMQGNLNIEVVDNLTILSPAIPSDTALIFYPGAKVEHIAYLPILKKLTEKGITCVLVEMPFNMAIFDSDAAEDVFEKLPEIKNWYIGGHSMGGAMASSYAAKNKDKIEGLILLGAYVYGDYPAEKALTVYGTFNSNLEKHIDYTENIVIIEGGNHAQFGNYGEQKGDPKATISAEEQQNITVEAILNFIQNFTDSE
ncbi:alpha/beta fold hydrolase [Oceanirhabdus sp. W0125-5]|uniref:alpha/beta fold hydrolase n=1 Tax=Oceanirhabdus sp. W0125-5 TaxID=2999116 RepID=UPI0022F306D4|nr:alpha/beta fold hydrolase [Oceanirhabdus sp. W0125-5]WBW96266.1 alpha/beta fold hydrolase [Oceanirhabdus sp. W0125-5]